MEKIELIEKYIILLLGVKDDSIYSDLHLQKEMFLLANSLPHLKEAFDFEKHYYGPYSQIVEEIIQTPRYTDKAFSFDGKKIFLSENGKTEYNKIIKIKSKENSFNELSALIKIIRSLYDSLSGEELLFLMYETFPEFTKYSEVSDNILKNKYNRKRILEGLYAKSIITDERYLELKNAKI
ncbi:MAG: hypothetical protein AABX23_00220 [Nanoarchaeota archaeon]